MDELEKINKQFEEGREIVGNASTQKSNCEKARTDLIKCMEEFPEKTINGEYDEEYLEVARNYLYWQKEYEKAVFNVNELERQWAQATGLVETNSWIFLEKYIKEYGAVFDHFDFDRRRFVVRFDNDKSDE